MQAIAAIGDMRNAEVFARGQQILHALGQQRAQRNLEGQGADINVVVPTGARMQINPVTPDADGIRKSSAVT